MPLRPAQHITTGAGAAEIEADRAALDLMLTGDRRARGAFVERFARLVYSVVGSTLGRTRHGGDEDLSDEVFAEVFVALFDRDARRLRQWSGGCSLASWVRLVAASVTVDRLRRLRDGRELVSIDTVQEALLWEGRTAIEAIVRAEELAAVGLALQRLSEPDRELLVALYVDELAPAEAAAQLGIALGALYTRKNRALQRLRRALDGEDGGEL